MAEEMGNRRLKDIQSWGYQLQKLDSTSVADSPYDLVVIDASIDGTDDGIFTREEVASFRKRPDGSDRLVIAYFSIGEAETYRGYWQNRWHISPPAWLGDENPNWPGNFVVRYWQDPWQDIILGRLDLILAAGFDGIYLDRVDVYLEFPDRDSADQDMIAFVSRLAYHARDKDPNFIVIGQNAENLLADGHYRYLIDGIGKEDLLFGLEGDGVPNGAPSVQWGTHMLLKGSLDGVRVFVIEYLNNQQDCQKADAFFTPSGFCSNFF